VVAATGLVLNAPTTFASILPRWTQGGSWFRSEPAAMSPLPGIAPTSAIYDIKRRARTMALKVAKAGRDGLGFRRSSWRA